MRSQYVRRSVGEPLRSGHIEQRVKHPEKKMFWGSFTVHGPGALDPVTGMMNSDRYIDVLTRKVLPQLNKDFPTGDGIFQHDLAPCHTSKKVTKFLQDHHIAILAWPGNSPDLNPIEEAFSKIKHFIWHHNVYYNLTISDGILFDMYEVMDIITPEDADGYFLHAGYF